MHCNGCGDELLREFRSEVFVVGYLRGILHRKRGANRREIHFKTHLCGYHNFAVLPRLGTLARQGQPAAIGDPSTVGLSVFVRQLQPDVIFPEDSPGSSQPPMPHQLPSPSILHEPTDHAEP